MSTRTFASAAFLVALLALPTAPPAQEQEPAPAPIPAAPDDAELARRIERFKAARIGFWKEPAGKNIDASLPFIGQQQRALRGAAFYAAVGRDDLARAFSRASRRRTILIVVGGIFSAAGLIVAETLSFLPWERGDAAIALHLAGEGIAAGVSIAGGVALLIGRYTNPAPVDAERAAGMAAEHNAAVRERLGLPPSTSRSDGTRWSLLPLIRANAAGMALAHSF